MEQPSYYALFRYTLVCFLALFIFVTAGLAQTLKLKIGQKFSYESLEDLKQDHGSSSSNSYSYHQYHYEVTGIDAGNYVLKVKPGRTLYRTWNRIYDSELPFAEQENDEMAIVSKVTTTLSFTIVIDITGKLVEVRDTAGIQDIILAKLKERNTLNVKHHNVVKDDRPMPFNYIQPAIWMSTSVFRKKPALPGVNILEKLPVNTDNISFKQDPGSGLMATWVRDTASIHTYANSDNYSDLRHIQKLNLINDGKLPLQDEAIRQLNYTDYQTSAMKAGRQIEDFEDRLLLDRGRDGAKQQLLRSIDSLDKYFKPDDHAYNAAKLSALSLVDGERFSDLLSKTPYGFLKEESHVFSKLNSELADGNTANLKSALQSAFTKFVRNRQTHPGNVHQLFNALHETWARKAITTTDPVVIKRMLGDITELETLKISAVTDMLVWLKNYCEIKLSTDPEQLTKLMALSGSTPFDNAGRYRTLIYDELATKKMTQAQLIAYNDQTIAMVKNDIAVLSSGKIPGMSSAAGQWTWSPRKVIYKKYLADAYYRKSLLQKNDAFLQMAADQMPSQQDLVENNGGLKREYEIVPYRSYTDLLLKADSGALLTVANLKKYVDLVIMEPDRYTILKERYGKANPTGDFKLFFSDALKEKLPTVPQFALEERAGRTITHGDMNGRFTFIDFWGTWCGPCIDEIHKIDALHIKNPAPEKLSVTTIACRDKKKNVDDFMTARKYTYPVLLSDGIVEENFNVKGYPTKFLVLPNGTYLNIPYQENYKVTLQKYLAWDM